ncbi:MAG: transglutaminase domain-containing protein, partial [Planctomycetota bacterium]
LEAARVLRPHAPAPRGPRLADAVDAVRGYFREEGFRYTLHLPPAADETADPLEEFLRRREGHCELVATVSCLFLRMMGVPARLAGGVRLAERIEEGSYIARFRNAHAWVEIPVRGAGFLAVDFTPPDAAAAESTEVARRPVDPPADPAAAATFPFDWSRPFDYGRLEQRALYRRIGEKLHASRHLVPLAAAIVVLALLAAFAARRARLPKSPLRVTAPEGGSLRGLTFYSRWLRRCAAAGHRRQRSQTPREFLHTLPESLTAEGRPLTETFERMRYSGRFTARGPIA